MSVVRSWGVAINVAGGKLRLMDRPLQWFLGLVERDDLREVALDAAGACAAAALPPLHNDPFDRAIVALAQTRVHRVDLRREHPEVHWRDIALVSTTMFRHVIEPRTRA